MKSRWSLGLCLLAAALVAGATDRTAELLAQQKDALALLDRIKASSPADVPPLCEQASRTIGSLAAAEGLVPAALRDELRSSAAALREGTLAADDARLR